MSATHCDLCGQSWVGHLTACIPTGGAAVVSSRTECRDCKAYAQRLESQEFRHAGDRMIWASQLEARDAEIERLKAEVEEKDAALSELRSVVHGMQWGDRA